MKEWYTAEEIAALALPGLPEEIEAVRALAQRERWDHRKTRIGTPCVVERSGEPIYSVAVFGRPAQVELARRHIDDPASPAPSGSDAWSWFLRQPDNARAVALQRLHAIEGIEALCAAGWGKGDAVEAVARLRHAGISTVYGWLAKLDGVAYEDRLPTLAPRWKGRMRGKPEGIDA